MRIILALVLLFGLTLPAGAFGWRGYGGASSSASFTLAADNALNSGGTLADTISTLSWPYAVAENDISEAHRVIFSNTGSGSAASLAVSYTGTNAADFSTAVTNCSGTLAAGSQCYLWIIFTPSTTGSESANAVLSYTGGSASIPLSASGTTAKTLVAATCSTFGGDPTLAANTIYRLAAGTCSGGVQFHTSAGTVVEGDCTSPEGATTIFDGGSTTGQITSGYADAISGVTLKCLTVQNYGYSGTACHAASGSANETPEANFWTGWLVANTTWQDSCGVAFTAWSTATVYQSHITANAYAGAFLQIGGKSGATSSTAGSLSLVGDEFDRNSNLTTGSTCTILSDCGAFKAVQSGQGGAQQSIIVTALYSHDNTGPSDDGAGAWCDVGSTIGYLCQIEGGTIIDNGGDGIRDETNSAAGAQGVFRSNVLYGNEITGTVVGEAQLIADCATNLNIDNNFVGAAGGDAAGAVIIGPDSRCSGLTFTWEASNNIVQMLTTGGFGSGWRYGVGSIDGTAGTAGTETSNQNTFYTGTNATSTAFFRDAPSATSNINFTTFQGAGFDAASTIATGTPTAMLGCSGDGTYGIGCTGSGMPATTVLLTDSASELLTDSSGELLTP